MMTKEKVLKGMSDTAPYKAWQNMMAACDNPTNPGYQYTGAKGIGYVANWKEWDNFWLQMRATYQEGARLVRKDKTKWFSVGNCVWQPKDGSPPAQRDSTASGARGLRLVEDKLGDKFWQVRYTKDGKRPVKMFSFTKYGDQKAYMLAICFLRKIQKEKQTKLDSVNSA